MRTSTAPEEMKYIASPRSPFWTMTSSGTARRGRSRRATERRVFASSAANIATRPTRSSRFNPRSRAGRTSTARRRGRNLRCKSSYMSWLIIDSARNQLNLKAVAEQPCERPRDADPMMDRARYTQGPVKGKYPARRLLVTGDTIAARSVPEPRGVSEKAGRHSPRHSPALEIIETEFLLAIGQNVERYPLPQLGGKFGLLDHSSKRSV